ncbi:MAG: ABC transporter ATP-binding protein [Ilumatobacteraceae bacterium]
MNLLPKSIRRIRFGVLLEALRTFRSAFVGQRGPLIGALLLALAATAAELLKPWPIKILFDEVLVVDDARPARWNLEPEQLAVIVAAVVLLIAVLHGVLTARAAVLTAEVGRKVTTRVRRQVFEHLHRLEMPYHVSARSGDLLIRLMGDVNLLRDGLVTSWLALAERGALFIGMAVVLLVIDPWLALAALAPMPLLAVRLRRSSRDLRKVTRRQRRKEGDAAAYAAETLRQVRVVKAYAREAETAQQFAQQTGSGEKAAVKAARIAARMSTLTEAMSGLGLALVLYVGAMRVRSGDMTAGDLVVATTYARMLFKPLRRVSREGGRLAKAGSGAERLLEVMREEPEVSGSGSEVTELAGTISFEDVTCRYDDSVDALRGLSFDLAAGTFAVVNGPSGSGKSTTLAVLLRLVSPTSGVVLLDGVPHDEYELRTYRRCFAYVPQEIELFSGTIRENILYGNPAATAAEVEEAAARALLRDLIESLPDGYDTLLGENGARLSGGQARRLMIARAAVSRASVLVLDEPLTGLDPDSRALVAAAVRHSAAGRTTLVVHHGDSDEFDPDVVLHIDQGRLLDADVVGRRDVVAAISLDDEAEG